MRRRRGLDLVTTLNRSTERFPSQGQGGTGGRLGGHENQARHIVGSVRPTSDVTARKRRYYGRSSQSVLWRDVMCEKTSGNLRGFGAWGASVHRLEPTGPGHHSLCRRRRDPAGRPCSSLREAGFDVVGLAPDGDELLELVDGPMS